jgi:hypothetical protein
VPELYGRIHPALTSFADECCGRLVRLMAYVGALALLATVGLHLWDRLPFVVSPEPSRRANGSPARRSYPALADSQFVSFGKTEAYEIFRHPGGGRKDVIRWASCGCAARSDRRVGQMLMSVQPFCLRLHYYDSVWPD